jgi:hypothetical protein
VACVAGFGVGAEDLPGVIDGDLVLVSVGGYDAEVMPPLLAGDAAGRRTAEQARPRRLLLACVVCQCLHACGDEPGGFFEVAA